MEIPETSRADRALAEKLVNHLQPKVPDMVLLSTMIEWATYIIANKRNSGFDGNNLMQEAWREVWFKYQEVMAKSVKEDDHTADKDSLEIAADDPLRAYKKLIIRVLQGKIPKSDRAKEILSPEGRSLKAFLMAWTEEQIAIERRRDPQITDRRLVDLTAISAHTYLRRELIERGVVPAPPTSS